jgi:general secretion pathway protein F
MATYRYRAARRDGRLVSGTMESPRAVDLTETLFSRGLFPLKVEDAGTGPSTRSAPRRDIAIVFRSLASLVTAGVPLEKAVASTANVAKGKLVSLLAEARNGLREGRTLAQALEAGNGLVPPLATGIVRAGERSGRLGLALDEVATHLEQEAELVSRVRQALAYPTLLAVVGTGTVLVIATVVVPRFAELLGDAGQRLPPATTALLAVSSLLTRYGWLILALLIGAALFFRGWLKRPGGKRTLHTTLLTVPVLGQLRQALASARCCRALAGMLEAGMPLLPALDASRDAVGDQAVFERLRLVRELVSQGAPLAQSLKREHALIPVAHQLIAVGESSGQLATMARRAGDLAAGEAERRIRSLVGMIEPGLIVLFGGLVAFVAAALLQAVYGLRAL